MNRRGLLKRLAFSVAALFGYKAIVVAEQSKHGKWAADLYAFAEKIWKSYGLDKPCPTQSPADFIQSIVNQLELTGKVYIWKVPNILEEVFEVHVIPTYKVICLDKGLDLQGDFKVDQFLVRTTQYDNVSIPIKWMDVFYLEQMKEFVSMGYSPLHNYREHYLIMPELA